MTDDDHDEAKVIIEDESVADIINTLKATLYSLPDRRAGIFENYVTLSLKDLDSEGESLNKENDSEFWNAFVMIYVQHSAFALESVHNHWMQILENSGWGWNTTHRPNEKMSPLLIEYSKLSQDEMMAVRVFAGIVWAMAMDDSDEVSESEAEEVE